MTEITNPLEIIFSTFEKMKKIYVNFSVLLRVFFLLNRLLAAPSLFIVISNSRNYQSGASGPWQQILVPVIDEQPV